MIDAPYYASGNGVYKHPVETPGPNGASEVALGFKICEVAFHVTNGAVIVAKLMNAGHVALRTKSD
jgi:hypothetical protein